MALLAKMLGKSSQKIVLLSCSLVNFIVDLPPGINTSLMQT